MLLGGTEQRIAQEAMSEWLAKNRNQTSSEVSQGNVAHLFESPLFLYLMQLDYEIRKELVYVGQGGETEIDDVVFTVINKRKA